LFEGRSLAEDKSHSPPTADRPLKIPIFENPRLRQLPYEKDRKIAISQNDLNDRHEIWYDDAE